MSSTPRQDLIDRLQDPEYAKRYGAEQARVDFAVTLAKARNSINITQKELSEKLDISQPYIAKLEGGETNPTLGSIGKILAVLGYRLATDFAPLVPEPIRTTTLDIVGMMAEATESSRTGLESDMPDYFDYIQHGKVGITSDMSHAKQEKTTLTLTTAGGSI